MAQPPVTPILAHENVRTIPALTQKTFFSAAAGAGAGFVWEFDLAARITDENQFVSALVAPANSSTTAGGGAGPQTTPQPAIGPLCDWFVITSGAGGGTVSVEYAVDASPCSYYPVFSTLIIANNAANASGLRVTGRFVRLRFTNVSAAAIVELGFYIRNT